MLLWINGPFGGGKTQTAYELHRRLPGSVVCDPEHAGFGLHRMMPAALRGDFQDLPAWRQGVYEVLDLVLRRHQGTVIAPMTLVDAGYFEEIIGRLRENGHEVGHFALLAERETVVRRLTERGWGSGLKRESFAVARPGPVRWIFAGPGRLAPHLAALSESAKYVQYEADPPPCDARHQTPRADPRRSAAQALDHCPPHRPWTTVWRRWRTRGSPSTSVPTG
ncbi:AAA family ATPase [Streptomyces scopuliridis]|uniref:AAA family ATPase n=1 Tax=Streptomyces scopuliridis TaxID=452529 RepID=A0ACD4ZJV9_9ACTN|nr:AAA family ATPase [Streptomyces scopuliridis]WSB98592.1 AAA family ATPase [Streptomyces scopuliridis]WSC07705.1 AAA family ATPase [Streptomyces scopuliridis]